MYPFRRAPEGQGEHVIWRSNTATIPDDVIDPQLLAASNNAADQPSLPQQPYHMLAGSGQGNSVEQTSVHQHPQLDVHHRQSYHFTNPQGTPQLEVNPHYNPQGFSPSRDGSVQQSQHFNPSFAYSHPQDGRVFFPQQQAAASPSLPPHPNRMSQGDTPASPLPRTPHLSRDSFAKADVQSPVKSKSRAFSRGFGQGPMSEADEGPFLFQSQADSSPLSSLTATPARPSGPDNTGMAMDLDDWESGREAEVGIPSSSPSRNSVTPQGPHQRQEEDLQGQEGQYQRPRRYNIDLLLESVTMAPTADMEIDQGVAEAASQENMKSASHDLRLQRPESQDNARPRAASLEIVTPPRGSILRRFGPGTGLSFPSGVPYSRRNSDYTPPPEDFWRPIFAARPMPPAGDLGTERSQPLSGDGRTPIDNVSGPQDGESSRHGQHLNPQVPEPSAPSSAAPQLLSGALLAARVKEVVEAADAILAQRRAQAHLQHLRPLAPKPPMQTEDISPQPPHHATAQQPTQSHDQTQTQQLRFTNMDQFQPLIKPPPPIQHPLLLSPFPLRIPGTFTPAILSLAINPPRSLQLGTPDSLQSYLRACGIVPYNDIYPRTFPVPVGREPFNRTVVVEARYLCVIGLLYPRAEFIVSRIAEGSEKQKVEPNSAVMMDKWHVYKAVKMSGEEMQKLGVCVWSEKGCREWEPVVERDVRGVMVDDDDDEEEEEEEEDEEESTTSTVAMSGTARGSRIEGKENVRQMVEEEDEQNEEYDHMETADAEEVHTSVTNKGKAKEVQVTNNKDKGKADRRENYSSGNAPAPSALFKATSASASAPRRSTRGQSQQASVVDEVTIANAKNTATPPTNSNIVTRKLRAIQLDDAGLPASTSVSRPIKTPKPRLPTTTTTTTKPPPPNTLSPFTSTYPNNYHHESKFHYLITLRQRDWPSGTVARIQCTPQARQTIESIQDAFGIQHPYEVWLQKDYRVWNSDTGKVKRRYIKVMRAYAGDEDTEDGLMRVFLDEMEEKMKEVTKRMETEKGKRKGKRKDGDEESGEGKDMARLEERMAWKEKYMALKRRGKGAVARAKGKRKEGGDMDMDYSQWLEERHEQEDELVERWFAERKGLVEEEELDRKTVEFALFEYGGGDGLGLGKP